MDHIDDKTEMLIEVAFWEYDMESKLKGDMCRSNRDAFKGQVRKVIRTLQKPPAKPLDEERGDPTP